MTTSPNREAAFIGKVTAAATHELRNALAIIKESAGLVDDLVRMSSTQGPPDRERIFKALGRIDAQVGRGAQIVTNLNRVAHAPDHDVDSIDLDRQVHDVVFHAQRVARKKGQLLAAAPAQIGLPFRANPLHVQMAIYAAIETCLDELEDGAGMEVRAGAHGGRPSVDLIASSGGSPHLAGDDGAWRGLGDALERLGVSLERSGNGNGLRLLFDVRE